MSAVVLEKKPRAVAKKSRVIAKKILKQLHPMSESRIILIQLCLRLMNRNFQVPLKAVERPDPSGRTLNELNVDRALKDYAAKSLFCLFTTHRRMSHNYKKFAERNPLQEETYKSKEKKCLRRKNV